jgi:hypothetical protein
MITLDNYDFAQPFYRLDVVQLIHLAHHPGDDAEDLVSADNSIPNFDVSQYVH